jgi:ATP-dependent RNA helicase DeaD
MAETPESGGPAPDDNNAVSTPRQEPKPAQPEPEPSDSGAEASAPPAPEEQVEPHADVEAAAPEEAEPPAEAEPEGAVETTAEAEPEGAVETTAEAEPEGAVETTAEAEAIEVPESFDAFELSDALTRAVAAMGWEAPMPVQAATFSPLMQGHDVMVQSHTGSGKTGAFCIPWLASRFEPGPAADTGVQLLVVLPTRELAKQVCDQLQKLSTESPVRTLPIYGGTAMQPQLAALADGVHAVVGTPGRLLDHLRRRSLNLSRVRTVVLDECDEMLSMGFLEDIRALLEACPAERQTCLFSATVPADIERIARRYMRDPQVIKLSGDQVAAAEIHHVFYSVAGTLKTRDLLDVIAIEEPTTALVFCNTREETSLVASVLKREGYAAEPLSSDLTQPQREYVMGKMRNGQIRFLVATDVAARGIDITHISHVMNYSVPESADVYVHRTGRTARAGRHGVALSLLAPQEVGSFYSLKLNHPSIEFEERALPPAEELARQRAEIQLDRISQLFPHLVSPEWTLLARTLAADPRGERVVAQLLEQAMTKAGKQRRPEEPRRSRERSEERRTRRGRGQDRRDEAPRERPSDRRKRRKRRSGPAEAPAEAEEPRTQASEAPAERVEEKPPEVPDTTAEPTAEEPRARADDAREKEAPERSGKRRRRRRRRKPKSTEGPSEQAADAAPSDGDAEAAAPEPTPEETASEQADEKATTARDPAEPASEEAKATPAEAKQTAQGEASAADGGARRRKRRRRRRRSDPPPSVPAVPHVPQDQIVIDIEASELEVVREEFGEIDELDDLTLKARRRAVIDVLQDEMELEDVSERDAHGEEVENDEENGEDEEDDSSPAEAAEPTEEAPSEASGDAAPDQAEQTAEPEKQAEPPKKKRRRRRRKKKKKEDVPIPELTAPPHKDFWEVWAEKFSFRDFEDEVFGPAAPVDEPEEAPAVAEWVSGGDEDEQDFVSVVLNIGRTHGMKAMQIRDLLRAQVGLAGKAIRDLTVHDTSTVFRIHPQRVERVAEVLGRCEEAGVSLELKRHEEPTTRVAVKETSAEAEESQPAADTEAEKVSSAPEPEESQPVADTEAERTSRAAAADAASETDAASEADAAPEADAAKDPEPSASDESGEPAPDLETPPPPETPAQVD